ncbi:PREDICTED: uncharacterized protein LOC105367975 [Ceratosolen solmsi marchali]|uniref:Uncharacterized protein LOC105367975 n=1 Tax=Ceratosolen solmsi marchali TaxID=326594 RepID=A0AAJ6YVG8_9HYME|nr:PREDICTED: uncharacterized protein LOC105367975 [Ceratosolen solmsi marchali]
MRRFWLIGILGLSLGLSESRITDGYGKLFGKCTKESNAFECLKKRALEILDNAIKDESVYVLNDFISIGRDNNVARNFELRKSDNVTQRSLDDQLDMKFHEYLSSRSLKLTIPGDAFEGRGKKDKKGGMGAIMMGGLAMAGMLAQLAFGKIAFLAGTALLTAKIALVLSAIIGLKKLVSSGGGGHEVIYATASEHHGGSGYGGGWQRALDAIPIT